MISITHIWKLRHTEVSDPPEVTQLSKGRTKAQIQIDLIPNPVPFVTYCLSDFTETKRKTNSLLI